MTEDEYREARHDILMRLYNRPELTNMPIHRQGGHSKVEDVALQLVELEQMYLSLQEDLDIPSKSLYNNGIPETNERRTDQMFSVMAARRKELGLSQIDLARKIGCSQPEISMMENGYQEIPERFMDVISEVLETPPDHLKMTYEEYLLMLLKKGAKQ